MIPRSDEEVETQRLYTLSQATQLGRAEPGLKPGHSDSGSGSFSSALLPGPERQAGRDSGHFPGLWFPGRAPWTGCVSIAGERVMDVNSWPHPVLLNWNSVLGCSSPCLNKPLWFGCTLMWEDPLFCK